MNESGFNIVDKGNIALLEFDLPREKVNKLSPKVMTHLSEVINELRSSSFEAVVLISRKKRIFIAGADIGEIKKITNKADGLELISMGQKILNELEDLPMLTVSAINGACMGGGLETALACDIRLASDDSSTLLALPEVKLGLFPGFGGCIRLPQVVGLQAALDMILTGKNIRPEKAYKMGLVSEVFPKQQFEERVLEWVNQKLSKNGGSGAATSKSFKKTQFKPKGVINIFLESPLGRFLVLNQAKKALLKQTKGFYPAPEKALKVISKTYGSSHREKSMSIEAELFCEVVVSEESKNLINLFYIMEGIKKQTGVQSKDVSPQKIDQLAVIGAGVMGGGIAHLAADKGFPIQMKDINNEALSLGFKSAYSIWNRKQKKKRLAKHEMDRKMSLISSSLDYSGFEKMDVVIEAVVEDMNIKKKVIKEAADHCKPHCIMASNTSSLSVSEMAEAHPHPQNFLGMHFFNPVHRMPLVEVIRGKETSDEATATIFNLCKKMGKTPVVVKDSPGFLVNRLLLPWMIEGMFLLEDGMSIETLDMFYTESFGLPMGPCRLLDEVGLDVGLKVLKIFKKSMGDDNFSAPSFFDKLASTDRLGRKNSKGFYLYRGHKSEVDQSIYSELGLNSKPKNPLTEKECIQRGIFRIINEASKALVEDKIIETPQEVDLSMILGAGFPPFRGGPLRYADSLGLTKIVEDLEVYTTKYGSRFKPSATLVQMANSNRSFY